MAKVALVTGCSSGLGRALALALHQQADPKYRVFASARNPAALEGLRAADIECVQLDVTDAESVKAAVAQVLEAAGRIDVVFNNAGLSRIGPLVEQPLSEVQEVFDTNVMGVLRMCQAVVPSMIRARSGLVVMTGSVGSHLSSPFAGAYNASKAALLTLSDTLRLELAPFGVGVTFCMAGAIRSSISENAASNSAVERYASPASAYSTFIDGIRRRLSISQDPSHVKSAEETAAQIVAVVNRWCAAGGRAPPTWFFAGGSALKYWAAGLLQKLFGAPTDGMMLREFGLGGAPPPPK